MLGRIEDRRRRGQQRMSWLAGITDVVDVNEFEQTLGDGGGQGSLACCSPWGHKESDMTEQLNNNTAKLRSPVPRALTWSDQCPSETGSGHRRAKGQLVRARRGRGGGDGIDRTEERPREEPALPTPGSGVPAPDCRQYLLLFKPLGPWDFGCRAPNTVPDRIQPRPEVLRVQPTPKRWPGLLKGLPSWGDTERHETQAGASVHVCCDPVRARATLHRRPQTPLSWSALPTAYIGPDHMLAPSLSRGLAYKPGRKAPAALVCLTRASNW